MPGILSGSEWWTKPCGDVVEYVITDKDDGQSDYGVIVAVAANRALDHAKGFREKYVNVTFGVSYKTHIEKWENNHYCWLNDCENNKCKNKLIVPKNLDENVSEEHKNSIKFNDFLVNAYEALQKCAVGLEQVTNDMTNDFKKNFEEIEGELRNVLCEMNTAISEAQASKKVDVTRSVMKDDIRITKNETERAVRGWFIFMEYMNVLEYIIQMFDHFKQK